MFDCGEVDLDRRIFEISFVCSSFKLGSIRVVYFGTYVKFSSPFSPDFLLIAPLLAEYRDLFISVVVAPKYGVLPPCSGLTA